MHHRRNGAPCRKGHTTFQSCSISETARLPRKEGGSWHQSLSLGVSSCLHTLAMFTCEDMRRSYVPINILKLLIVFSFRDTFSGYSTEGSPFLHKSKIILNRFHF